MFSPSLKTYPAPIDDERLLEANEAAGLFLCMLEVFRGVNVFTLFGLKLAVFWLSVVFLIYRFLFTSCQKSACKQL